jgi:hypothetical protein
METIDVDHVETADDDPVQEDGPKALEASGPPDEPEDLSRRIPSVDPDPAEPHRLDPVRRRHRHRGDRSPHVAAPESAVIHSHDPGVLFGEGAPQG